MEDKEVEAAIGYSLSLSLVGTEGAENIGAAHVMHYLHNSNHIKAREIIDNMQLAAWPIEEICRLSRIVCEVSASASRRQNRNQKR